MDHTSDTLHRLKIKLKRHLKSSHLTSEVIRNLGTEKNWQKMLDNIEYAYELGERLSPRRILMKSAMIGLRKAPDALRVVRGHLR